MEKQHAAALDGAQGFAQNADEVASASGISRDSDDALSPADYRVEFEDGREDIVYQLDTLEGVEHMRTTPFVMEEGSRYRFVIAFRVNQTIVSGLRFCNKVKKTVLASRDEIVLGSYAPRSESYVFVYPRHAWMDAPSGLFYRGKYMGRFRFVDDDRREHLQLFYTFGTSRLPQVLGCEEGELTDICFTAS
ncbi:hypothetical protein BBJ28_00015365 [Nothophytophthora sp. Chile5]|nr:hypothetical protein BBJ28_00015365 [Nothophytophthora sp. Chile5]